MEDELQEVMKQRGKVPLKNFSLRTLCVAQYPDSEQRWCRCVVISSSDQKVQLLSIDYGLLFEADIGQVCSLPASPEDLRLLSYQAIECYMATVMPVGGVWSDETGDLLWELGSNSTSLYAKVLTTKPSTFLGDTSYGIELIERKQHEQDLYFSKLLLSKQLALERKLNIMEQLGLSCEADHLDYPFQLIPRLVRLLNKTANHERRLLIVAYIRQLVLDSLNLKDEMRQQGVLKSLCNLVNTVNLQDDILSHVLESFAALTFNNLENCEELWWENGFTFLHEKLELCDDNGLLTRVLSCLSCLIKANCIRTEADSLVSFSTNLIHIARSSTLPQNKRLSLEVLNSYLDKDIKRANSLLRGDIVRVTTGLLLTSDDVIEASCILIDSLILALPKQSDTASWDTTISQMAVTMFKVKSETALQHCAKTLHTLLNNLPGAKTILKNTVLHAKLERLVNSGLNSLTREVCINILVKVRPECPVPQTDTRPRTNNRKEQDQSIKSSQELYLQPLVKSELPTFMNQIPKVLWWECSKFLMIQVQVHDALTLDPPPSLTYKAEKLHFSCGPYQFTLGPLYDTIVSKKSGREIYSSEIKYALYKEKRKLWSNLMKPGYKKPSYVQSNMDLMITSSDDEEGIDYSKSPFLIKPTPTLKYSPFERIQPGTSIPAELPPPVDELLSSDEKEEEEDERFDHEYKKQYDFFNV
ncbi:uncharacterized protein [Watersipora subatra]|uniref:uncharacterized protein n=1 Tax=Watersipora subatra TaxID=2589382 RepID=UPI00355B3652